MHSLASTFPYLTVYRNGKFKALIRENPHGNDDSIYFSFDCLMRIMVFVFDIK